MMPLTDSTPTSPPRTPPPDCPLLQTNATHSYNVESLVGNYRDWSLAVGKSPTQVAVLYASDYGFSDRLSQTLARGVTKAGVATEMVDVLSADPQVRNGERETEQQGRKGRERASARRWRGSGSKARSA